jgi:MFS family permease
VNFVAFLALRTRAKPARIAVLSRSARRRWRRLATDDASGSQRFLPPEKRGVAFALYGISAVLAPTVGPMLGGWITDSYSWRWIYATLRIHVP